MTRPSHNTDQRLIQAARELIPETGFSGLSLRKVAERAGVNLGMFHYYFKDKQAFLRQVMQETYEEFFRKFTLEVSTSGEPPEVQLRKTVRAGARFIRDNRQLLLAFARDATDGDREIVRFLEKNFHRHIVILVDLFRKSKKAGKIGDWPLPMALAFLAGSVLAPSLFAAVAERTPLSAPYSVLKKLLVPKILSDPAIDARLELAFFALADGGRNVNLPKASDDIGLLQAMKQEFGGGEAPDVSRKENNGQRQRQLKRGKNQASDSKTEEKARRT